MPRREESQKAVTRENTSLEIPGNEILLGRILNE